jgi:hypothetical protein
MQPTKDEAADVLVIIRADQRRLAVALSGAPQIS